MAEAKSLYRKLAMTMHPDVGGDTDEFALLASEYAALQVQQSELNIPSYDDVMEPLRRKITLLTDFLNEVYPRTSISIMYSYASVDVYFNNATPLPKMLEIEKLIHTFDLQWRTVLYFRRGGSVKWYSIETTDGFTFYCNMPQDGEPDCGNSLPVYEGRRYTIVQNKKYSVASDKKTGLKIIMKRTPKFTLQELMGL